MNNAQEDQTNNYTQITLGDAVDPNLAKMKERIAKDRLVHSVFIIVGLCFVSMGAIVFIWSATTPMREEDFTERFTVSAILMGVGALVSAGSMADYYFRKAARKPEEESLLAAQSSL
jgi:thiol:disulfide interchange protein